MRADLTLKSESGPESTIINGGGNGTVLISDCCPVNFTLDGFTLTGGNGNASAISGTMWKSTFKNLIIKGNISDPDSINRELMKKFKINLKDLLNSRTFLDHNRIYSDPKTENKLSKQSTGGFCFKGNYISSDQLGNNLIEHLSLWKPYINKHGIIILELHTIHPDDSNKYRGENLSCAYDTTHGFSDQYIIEVDIMLEAAMEAGLKPVTEYETRFPNDEITTISINLFRSNN